MFPVVRDEVEHLPTAAYDSEGCRNGQTPATQQLIGLRLAHQGQSDVCADPMHQHVQWARCSDRGVLLPQRPGGGVPRIRERRLAGRHQRRIQVGEPGDREEDLAAYLDQFRNRFSGQRARHITEGCDVAGDVLPHPAITTGRPRGKTATAVDQIDDQSVDLQLTQPGNLLARQHPLHPGHPVGEFVRRKDIVKTEQSLQVGDRSEVGHCLGGAHPLTRAVRGAQLREGVLQLLKLAHQSVVLGVRHGRRVAPVVPLLGFTDQVGQLRPTMLVGQSRLSHLGLIAGLQCGQIAFFIGHAPMIAGHTDEPPSLVRFPAQTPNFGFQMVLSRAAPNAAKI